jgi:hypothetical protein
VKLQGRVRYDEVDVEAYVRANRLGLSEKLVLSCARHTYGSYTVEAAGNIFGGRLDGLRDLQTMKPYQHHRLEPLCEAINLRKGKNG